MENTAENIIAAIVSRGYVAPKTEKHIQCECGNELLNADAISCGLMGCMVMGTNCLNKYYKKPVADVIAEKIAHDKFVAGGGLTCSVCGKRGATHYSGEGRSFCAKHAPY